MAILDQLLGKSAQPGSWSKELGLDFLPGVLRSSDLACLEISEVFRFFYEGTHRDTWSWTEDFPCCLSPFPFAWYEAVASPTIFVAGRQIPQEMWKRQAFLVVTADEVLPEFVDHAIEAGGILNREAVFTQRVFVFGEQRAGGLFFLGHLNDLLDANGIPLVEARTVSLNTSAPAEDQAWMADQIGIYCLPLALATSFLTCKNVTVVERPVPEKLRRARIARGQHPGVTFRELRIDPMRKILRAEGRSGEVGLKRALHICRGHFATYTEEKPLFGRVTGTFWVPAHVRGSKDAGEVRKSYKVMAPKG